jgi:8-oxo-dGTP diphosphatase
VGVGCLVFKESRLLLGRRVDETHGNGEFCGGGHVELQENLAESARREIREEWAVEIDLPQFLCAINIRNYNGLHYISFGFKANWLAGEPRPEVAGEFADYRWYALDALPSPLFRPVPFYLEAFRTGQPYFEVP